MLKRAEASRKGFMIKGNTPLCITILFLIILSGCAKKEVLKTVPDEEILRDRIVRYWDHKIKDELDKSYEYESPLNKMTLTSYIKKYSNPAIDYKSYELMSIDRLDDDIADVQLKIVPVVKVPGARALEHTTIITERWVKVEDIWYHTSQKVSNKPIQKKEEGGD